MNILFDWCASNGVEKVMGLIRTIISVIRWVVPIGLILMLSIDIFKKVIDPNEKEGQKIIVTRVIAAIIVFLVPLLINLVLRLVDIGGGHTPGDSGSITRCMGWY